MPAHESTPGEPMGEEGRRERNRVDAPQTAAGGVMGEAGVMMGVASFVRFDWAPEAATHRFPPMVAEAMRVVGAENRKAVPASGDHSSSHTHPNKIFVLFWCRVIISGASAHRHGKKSGLVTFTGVGHVNLRMLPHSTTPPKPATPISR